MRAKLRKPNLKFKKITYQVESYSNQLIHQISDNQDNKELLNRILSTDISSLSSDHISDKISKTENLMKLFDGVIKLPNGLKGKPIESIEDLKQQIKEFEKEKKAIMKNYFL